MENKLKAVLFDVVTLVATIAAIVIGTMMHDEHLYPTLARILYYAGVFSVGWHWQGSWRK